MTGDIPNLDLNLLTAFISAQQRAVIQNCLKGDEASFFKETLEGFCRCIDSMPVTYEQDGKGEEAIAYLHYFTANSDWYIIELDMEDKITQATGYASIGGSYPELGYIHIPEILAAGAELDLHWKPAQVKTIQW